jgi:hypothetical protein
MDRAWVICCHHGTLSNNGAPESGSDLSLILKAQKDQDVKYFPVGMG